MYTFMSFDFREWPNFARWSMQRR